MIAAGSSLRGLDHLRGAFGADQFRPDAVPRLAAQIPPTKFALRQRFKSPSFGGAHVAAPAQALVKVGIAGAGIGGEALSRFGCDLGTHAPHHSDSLQRLQAIRYELPNSTLLENAQMETASQRRKRKLIALCDQHGLGVIASKAALNPATIDQIIKSVLLPKKLDGTRSVRSLGDPAARAIEAALELGFGWFDADAKVFEGAGTVSATAYATLTPGAPTPAAQELSLRTAFTHIAKKMRVADPAKREVVAVLMREIALRPEAMESTLTMLFQILDTPDAAPVVAKPTLAQLAAAAMAEQAAPALPANVYALGEQEAIGLLKTKEQKAAYRATHSRTPAHKK
ncbi:MAG: hypothetical protein H7255_16860 [Ramlibacter sp.]|nr:hypothetical protein [Ramlibacter sp.]